MKTTDNDTADDKMEKFMTESKNKKGFEEKIKNLFLIEFEDKITHILLTKESEFLSSLSAGVKIIIEEMFGIEACAHKITKDTLRTAEKVIYKEFYVSHYKILSSAFNEYEANLEAIKKHSSKISSKNSENFSFLKNFRKHCKYTDNDALHLCQSKMLEVTDENENVTHVICVDCKKCYLSNSILLCCFHCNIEYYSNVLEKGESVNIQQATWEKYHCGALINDKMKCIKCREPFYINLKTNKLQCLNCKFEANPSSIAWSCIVCKKEFKSEAKIYNPMEFKQIKQAIKQVLLLKQRAKPLSVPCCKINIYKNIFYHKKECNGEIFQGELNHKIIVVCEKCKSMNFYEKYIWTCPKCERRFRQKMAEDNDPNGDSFCSSMSNSPIRNSISSIGSAKAAESLLKLHPLEVMEEIQRKSSVSKFSSTNEEESADKKFDKKKSLRPKTLIEILEERKSVQHRNLNASIQYDSSPLKYKKGNDEQLKTDRGHSICFTDATDIKKNLDSDFHKKAESPFRKNRREEFAQLSDGEEENKVNKSNNKESALKGYQSNLQKNLGVLESRIINVSGSESSQIITNVISNKNNGSLKNSQNLNQVQLGGPVKVSPLSVQVKTTIQDFNIDDYKILRQIGEGSYGKIYLVEDSKTLKKYGMKKIIAHDIAEVEAFKQEFELVYSVNHENIMQIYGLSVKCLDITTYALYVLMELAVSDWNEEVKTRLNKKKPYTEEELLDIMGQLIEGLGHLQKNNISHRDLKPQNVLVFPDGVYKVADFGEAKEVKLTKQLNTLRGTELYMSPILFEGLKENLDDVTHNTYKSDVFSLGYCFLYAATLTFNSIYDIRDLTEMKQISAVLSKHLKNKYSSKLINLIGCMIDVNEVKRLDFLGLTEYLKHI